MSSLPPDAHALLFYWRISTVMSLPSQEQYFPAPLSAEAATWLSSDESASHNVQAPTVSALCQWPGWGTSSQPMRPHIRLCWWSEHSPRQPYCLFDFIGARNKLVVIHWDFGGLCIIASSITLTNTKSSPRAEMFGCFLQCKILHKHERHNIYSINICWITSGWMKEWQPMTEPGFSERQGSMAQISGLVHTQSCMCKWCHQGSWTSEQHTILASSPDPQP